MDGLRKERCWRGYVAFVLDRLDALANAEMIES